MWFIGSPVPRLLRYQWHSQVIDDARALHAFVVVFFLVGWEGGAGGMLP